MMRKICFVVMLTFCMILSQNPVLADSQLYIDSRGNELIIPDNAWATRVVEFIPGNPWTNIEAQMDESAILGKADWDKTKDINDLTIGCKGSITLEFDVFITDGEGDDIYVFEVGDDVEPTHIEVSADLKTWYDVGDTEGSFSGVDLAGKVPENAKFKYVRITDLGKYSSGRWPGADIDAVAGLNIRIPASGSEWATPELEEADLNGLIPENFEEKDLTEKITRGEFAAVSVKLYEALTGEKTVGMPTLFQDISGNENKTDIEKAYRLNIAVGYSDIEFGPDLNINREELATMLCRTIKKYKFDDWSFEADSEYYLDCEGVKLFADDADISDYAKPSVYYMSKMGIVNGYDDTHFAPKNTTDEQEALGYATATREQAIALSLRIYKLSDILRQ